MGPYLLRMLSIRVQKGAFGCQKGAFAGGRSTVPVLRNTKLSEKGTFSCYKGAFAGGRGAIYS